MWSWVGPTKVAPRSEISAPPIGWLSARPPTRLRASSTTTDRPALTSLRAAVRPAKPAPTTATSASRRPIAAPTPGARSSTAPRPAAAGADRGAAEPAAAPAQLVDERADDACAGGTDRVPERDRAPVHVDLVLVDAEHPHRVDRHRRERLVDLPQVDVLRGAADLLERLLS